MSEKSFIIDFNQHFPQHVQWVKVLMLLAAVFCALILRKVSSVSNFSRKSVGTEQTTPLNILHCYFLLAAL